MSTPLFFILICLGLIAVMRADYWSWIPKYAPRVAQQCIQKYYSGRCSVAVNGYELPVCSNIPCAKRVGTVYRLVRKGWAATGTICGILKVCRFGRCVDIPEWKVPENTGSEETHDCH